MKQETLEEVATKVLDRKYPYHRPTDAGYWKDMFISGANYQAERMYSEEDMKLAWEDGRNGTAVVGKFPFIITKFKHNSFTKWFEQFKKK
jgi:hypothetical protein